MKYHTQRTAMRPAAPLTACLLTALLAGCSSLAPGYQRPAAPVAAQWPTQEPQQRLTEPAADARPAVDLPWQDLYVDPKLRQVIALALDNNRDLRVAALNIERARAQYRIQRAALLPEVAAGGGQTAQRTPASVSAGGSGGVSRAYTLDVGISAYEIDVFGRLSSLKDAALQSYLATDETRRATHISLISEVAGAYLSLAADLDLQRLAQETLASRQQSYDLQAERAQNGNTSALELRQAEGELEAARAQALGADQQVALDRNALELLAGAPLDPEQLPASGALAHLLGTHDIPTGLPSDLLRNRPDVLAAEHRLVGAHADIGAARAAFFPSISLTATVGRASSDLSNLFDGGGRSWGFIPQINLPIFSGGRLQAQLETSQVDRDIAVAQYEHAIQTAFREVADTLAKRSVVDGQWTAQRRRAEAAREALDLVQLRYDNGVAGYLEVLDAQRTLYTAQQSLIQAELSRQSSLVTLYKVLGGGWSQATEQVAALPASQTPR